MARREVSGPHGAKYLVRTAKNALRATCDCGGLSRRRTDDADGRAIGRESCGRNVACAAGGFFDSYAPFSIRKKTKGEICGIL